MGSSFFKTALGGVISNLTTIDTTHFKTMNGHIELKDAIVHILPITSNGNVLNLHIAGDMDILKKQILILTECSTVMREKARQHFETIITEALKYVTQSEDYEFVIQEKEIAVTVEISLVGT